MNNSFFSARHGHSLANQSGIILSGLADGQKPEYTLTAQGEDEVRSSAIKAKESGALGSDAIIVSSPFSRCRRTAEIIKEVLGVKTEIIFDDRLRERWFGNWERTSNANYQKVWDIDKNDPHHTEESVESAAQVQARTLELVKDLDGRFHEAKIVLVSHGDALQILETGIKKLSPSAHRDLPHLQTAEIRKLELV